MRSENVEETPNHHIVQAENIDRNYPRVFYRALDQFDIHPSFTSFIEPSSKLNVLKVTDHTAMYAEFLSCDLENNIFIAVETEYTDLHILQWDALEKFDLKKW